MSTAGICINGRAPGWAWNRTSRQASNCCRTWPGSLNTWRLRVCLQGPSDATWTTSGLSVVRSFVTCTMTRVCESYPPSAFSGRSSMKMAGRRSTTAPTSSNALLTQPAASSIVSSSTPIIESATHRFLRRARIIKQTPKPTWVRQTDTFGSESRARVSRSLLPPD